ncbi:hypothetical protein RND81_01G092600 [Saponaria officinalis]|uniref:Uncharacterized protein n=1 Tax=Saponaria officinalis TaxID=3572 RepID=A0AAW1NDQ7_SAPOF
MWKPTLFHVQPIEYNAQFIHCLITDVLSSFGFHCTMVYAFNDTHARKLLWEKMRYLRKSVQGAWVTYGDFYTILHPMERMGGMTTNEEMEDFCNCLEDCGLTDGTVNGCFSTWNNKQKLDTRIYNRLDRFLVNQEWINSVPDAYAYFHNEGLFDHTPCTIQLRCSDVKGKRSFKYFNMWSGVDDFIPYVARCWGEYVRGTKMFRVVKRFQMLKNSLKQLSKSLFDDFENNAIRAGLYLEYLQQQLRSDPMNPMLIDKEHDAAVTYCELKRASDSFLLQKSKAHWVCEGDSNTKYFHSIIKGRQVRNKVLRISNIHGHTCTDADQIQNAFLEFYKDLLGSSSHCVAVNKTVVQLRPIYTQDH